MRGAQQHLRERHSLRRQVDTSRASRRQRSARRSTRSQRRVTTMRLAKASRSTSSCGARRATANAAAMACPSCTRFLPRRGGLDSLADLGRARRGAMSGRFRRWCHVPHSQAWLGVAVLMPRSCSIRSRTDCHQSEDRQGHADRNAARTGCLRLDYGHLLGARTRPPQQPAQAARPRRSRLGQL